MALGFLEKRGSGAVQPEQPGSRVNALVLTSKGRDARDTYHRLVWAIEERWELRFGKEAIQALRKSLEGFTYNLLPGLKPYPEGWWAMVPPPQELPDYPMILHRGGFPDGS